VTSKYKFEIVGNDKTKKMFKSITGNLRRYSNLAGKVAGAVGVAAAAGLAKFRAEEAKVIDELGKFSDRLDFTTEKLAGYHHVTELNGESAESFNKSIEKMVRSIGEFDRGFGTGKKAFEDLGLTIDDLKGRKADEQFEIIAQKIAGLSTQTEKASVAADIFGRKGIALLNTINQGAAGFEAAQKEVELYGLALDRVDVAKVEESNDAAHRLGKVWKGFNQQLTVKTAPLLTKLSEKTQEFILSMGGMGALAQKVIMGGARAVGVFADGWRGLQVVFKGVELGLRTLPLGVTQFAVMWVEAGTTIYNAIVDGVLWPTRTALQLISKIPGSVGEMATAALGNINELSEGFKVTMPESMLAFRDAQAEAFGQTKAELDNLLLSKLPSDVILENINQIMSEADARIKEKISNMKNGGPATQGGEELSIEEQREKDRFMRKLERMRTNFLTEQELLNEQRAADLADLEAAEEKKYITYAEYLERRYKLNAHFDKRQKALDKKSSKSSYDLTVGILDKMSGASEGQGKRMFEFSKAASLAKASATLPSAVIDTFNNNGGYPWGIIPAGLMLKEGLKQISSIKKSKIGGGASTPSVGGGGGGSSLPGSSSINQNPLQGLPGSNQNQEVPERHIVINFHGDVNSNHADTLIDDIRERLATTDKELIPADSRNAADIRGDE